MAQQIQTYANHRRYVPLYHYVLTLLLLAALGGSIWLLTRALGQGEGRLAAGLILLLVLISLLNGAFVRIWALKAQDRAIRAEESLRHYLLTGQPLDPRLTIRQIIGLRFASDGELAALARRAAEEGLSEEQIKREVTQWRADDYRV
ncbi:MAG: DUF6526 family protein [Thermoanaerobaculia bacterium]|nr:DUF6526 family protein [Thermoanaerobaculia bacterium]